MGGWKGVMLAAQYQYQCNESASSSWWFLMKRTQDHQGHQWIQPSHGQCWHCRPATLLLQHSTNNTPNLDANNFLDSGYSHYQQLPHCLENRVTPHSQRIPANTCLGTDNRGSPKEQKPPPWHGWRRGCQKKGEGHQTLLTAQCMVCSRKSLPRMACCKGNMPMVLMESSPEVDIHEPQNPPTRVSSGVLNATSHFVWTRHEVASKIITPLNKKN